MTSAHRAIRRRLTLLASSSAGAIALMAAAGGATIFVPESAMAADECGLQSGSTPIVCLPGAYPTGISYAANGGDLNLVLQDNVDVSQNGLTATSSLGENVSVTAQTATSGTGDLVINNAFSYGVFLATSGGGDITLDLTDDDSGDGPAQINGVNDGVVALSGGGASLNTGNASVTATGLFSTAIYGRTAGGDLTIRAGGLLTASYLGISATSFGGAVDIATTSDADFIPTGSLFTGINASAATSVNIVVDGDIGSSTQRALDGIQAFSGFLPGSGGDVDVTVNGDVYVSQSGIAVGNNSTAGDATINFGLTRAATLDNTGWTGLTADVIPISGAGNAVVNVGDDATVGGSLVTIWAGNSGTGNSSVNLGSGVTLNGANGAWAMSAGRSKISAGDNLVANLSNGPFWGAGVALYARTTASADTSGPSAEIDVGQNATLTNNNAGSQNQGTVWALAVNGTASAAITVGDGLNLAQAGEYVAGLLGVANLGDVNINVGTGSIALTGGAPAFGSPLPGNVGILAHSSGGNLVVNSAADINVFSVGGASYGIWGDTSGSGNVALNSTGDITSAAYGLSGSVVDGDLNIFSSGAISANTGIDASASGTGSVTVEADGAIGQGLRAIKASAQSGAVNVHTGSGGDIQSIYGIWAQSAGPVTVTADGDFGTAATPTWGAVSAIGGWSPGGPSSDVSVTVDGDVYTSNWFTPAVRAAVWGDTGSATVNFGMTRAANLQALFSGLIAEVDSSASTADATVTVGDGATLQAVRAAQALNSGLGNSTVQFGSGVTLNNTLLGAHALSNARSLVTVGDNLTVQLQNDVFSGPRSALYAETAAMADAGAPSAEIVVGNNATVVNTDVDAYDASVAYAHAPNGTASARITVGDGLNVQMAGEYVVGLAAVTNLGDADVTVGSGSISLTGGNDPGVPTIAPGNIGIIAASQGGNVSVNSAVNIDAFANAAPVIGIDAYTIGSGNVTVASGGAITSTGAGINGSVVDGALSLSSSGSVSASDVGILGSATGAGSVMLANGGSVSGAPSAIVGDTQTGMLTINNGGSASGDVAINATSIDGRIVIGNSGSVTGTTTGILATTTGASRISVASSGSVQGGDAAIDVSTNGGALAVNATGALSGDVGLRAVSQDGTVHVVATGGVSATTTGIDATANGAGPLVVEGAGVQAGGVGILATTATSDTLVIARGDVTGGTGPAIKVNSGGAARVVVGGTVATAPASTAIDITAAGNATIDNSGTIRSTLGRVQDTVLVADAANVALNNSGLLQGAVDFSASDALTFNNAGTWRTGGMSLFTDGDDTLTNTGAIIDDSVTIDFGAGSDTFANAGTLVVGEAPASTLTLANLETFNNSGLILFGSVNGTTSDGEANDRLVAHGAAFTGSGASTLAMDVDLGAASQANCSAATVADCFDLTGGSTAGSTLIRVTDTGQSAGALNTDGIVLVDVHGGTSHAADFTLDPGSSGYTVDPTLGAGLEKGVFLYKLDYDAANQRHRLVSLPGSRVFEFSPLAASAQSVWYTSTGTWFDRQADLRDNLAAGDAGPGAWVKIAGSNADRDMKQAYSQGGSTYLFDTSHKQDTVAVSVGLDLVHGAGDGQAYVAGLTAGNLNSDVQFDVSGMTTKFEGQSYGAYASWLNGPFFVDGIVQTNHLDMRDGAVRGARGKLKSTGGQIEGGWRMPFAMVSVEPLASLAYVRTKFDDLALPGASLHTEEAKSLRGSLGVRVSGDTDLHSATLKFQLTARAWDEFEGKNRAVLTSNGQAIGLPDDVSGAFGDVSGGISLYSPSGHVSTFLNVGEKFKSDYRSTDTAIGFRVQW